MIWRTKMSPEGEGGVAPSIYRDIYSGDDEGPLAERIPFDEADYIVDVHNRQIRECTRKRKRKQK